MHHLIHFLCLGLGIGLAGYSAARPIHVATQSERISQWLSQSGLLFFVGIALIVVAAVMMRRSAAALVQGTGEQQAGDPAEMLAALKAGADSVLVGLQSDAPQTQVLCDQIDALRDGPIQGLVECKEAMVAGHGMLAFAQFISAVSAGERNLNRAWSTLVDGYPAEALKAAERAQNALQDLTLPGAA
jgi:hypothetical protein